MGPNGTSLALIVAVVALAIVATAASARESAGRVLFTETHKCNLCHAVPAAGIEAETRSQRLKGADLGGKVTLEFKQLAAYVRSEGAISGKRHAKPFKGSDEELQAIIDWLGSLEAR